MSVPHNYYKDETRKFGETISVRGIPRIVKSQSKFVKIFWTVAVLISTSVLLWQLSTLFSKYFSYPSATKIEKGKEAPVFPDVTFCNIYPMSGEISKQLSWEDYLRTVRSQKVQTTLEKIQHMTSKWNISDIVYEQVWDYLQSSSAYFANFPMNLNNNQDLPNLITACQYTNWDWSSSDDIQCSDLVKTFWNPSFFKCYALRVSGNADRKIRGFAAILYVDDFPDVIDDAFDLDVKETNARGVRLVIHNPGTFPNMKEGINIAPGTETTIRVTPTIRSRLDKPYRPDGCTSQKYLQNSVEDLYSFEACYDVCIQSQMIENCQCVYGFYQFTQSQLEAVDYKVCGNQSLLDSNLVNTSKMEFLLDILCVELSDIDTQRCTDNCQLPCKENTYDYTYDTAPWPHVTHQLAFYESYIQGESKIYGNNFEEYEEIYLNYQSGTTNATESIKKLRQLDLIERNFAKINLLLKVTTPFLLTDVPQISVDALLASIGGTLSLWLGITVMTIVEVFEFFYNLLVIIHDRRKTGSSIDMAKA